MGIRTSFGGKNFRVSLGKGGIGYSFGTKGFRVSHRASTHRANSKNNNAIWWLLVGWWIYLFKYMFIGIWYLMEYTFIGLWCVCKFLLYTLPCKIIKTIKDICVKDNSINE